MAQVTRRFARAGEVSEARGREVLEDLDRFPLERYGHRLLLPRVWELRANVTAYDAVYLALSEALDAPLVTRDRALVSVPGTDARVEVV